MVAGGQVCGMAQVGGTEWVQVGGMWNGCGWQAHRMGVGGRHGEWMGVGGWQHIEQVIIAQKADFRITVESAKWPTNEPKKNFFLAGLVSGVLLKSGAVGHPTNFSVPPAVGGAPHLKEVWGGHIQFLQNIGFDPAADTPVELLHTILLGAVKYVWHISHTPWSAEKKKTYSIQLQATSTEGLSIHAIRANYIMQYAGSLIGRQFKTIIQTAVFHLHDLVTEDQFTTWIAVGELSALLWVPEIRDLTQYRNDLKIAVANVLDAVAQIDPSKIMTKIKYHLLIHIDFDAIELGPLIAMAMEIFESFNAVFCYCSIYSNHLAPSWDIAIQFGRQETVKHQLTGGRWMSKSTGDWHGASTGVRHFIEKHPILQRLVGWTPEKQMKHGDTKLAPLKRGIRTRPVELLKSTNAARALNFGEYSGNSEWMRCKIVVSESLDECFVGTWNSIICGRLSDILCNQLGVVIFVVELFQIMGVQHSRYGMPVLARRDNETTFSILPAKVQQCEAMGVRPVMQERVESDNTEHFIVHTPLDHFIINTHSFHNPHLVRATVSRDFWAPVALFEDRRAKPNEFSARLRESRASLPVSDSIKQKLR
ncbi:hypothetical protein B0H14DRAFT_2641787 [Mycena olivaceomarginata]|nr:hypothetical protein B0H14DRAFT_2641787 [Mycena olivaceomarginata]